MSLLPAPTTAGHYHKTGSTRRRLVLLLCSVVFITYIYISVIPRPQRRQRINLSELDRLLTSELEPQKPQALSSLGPEADRTYQLGSLDGDEYHVQLRDFLASSMPDAFRERAIVNLDAYFDSAVDATHPPIPPRIWQTHPTSNDEGFGNWRGQYGYDYQFLNDKDADKWVQTRFAGSQIGWLWEHLDLGILKADLLRYLLLMIEGGTYSDMDTDLLRPIQDWGANFDSYRDIPANGPPSMIVGIEADVGNRRDWHDWWARPLQICQWTISSAPFHPVLVDTIRKIHNTTIYIEEWNKDHHATSGNLQDTDDERGGVTTVMEWTGPGVFTDSVIKYLNVRHNMTWPALKDRTKPLRAQDIVVLPVTGFSPGVGLFNAKQPNDPQAMVHHMFAGSWKNE